MDERASWSPATPDDLTATKLAFLSSAVINVFRPRPVA